MRLCAGTGYLWRVPVPAEKSPFSCGLSVWLFEMVSTQRTEHERCVGSLSLTTRIKSRVSEAREGEARSDLTCDLYAPSRDCAGSAAATAYTRCTPHRSIYIIIFSASLSANDVGELGAEALQAVDDAYELLRVYAQLEVGLTS